jgi:hypothetical protein
VAVTTAPTGAKSWSPDQIVLQAWLALPKAAREPRSQRALAAELEVDESTLSDWKKLPGFNDAVYALVIDHVVGELVPVLHAQVREAKKGSLPHAQWLAEICGKWTPRARLDHSGTVEVVTVATVREALGIRFDDDEGTHATARG